MIKLLARLGAPILVVLALAGCGSSSTTTATTATPTTSTSASGGAVSAIAAQVPAAVKSKGTLTVAAEAEYAPNEFIASDGHTLIGMDPDLVSAVAEVMGLKAKFVNANFETIIPGLAAGRYDLGASSFTDTKEREKTVDFVDYYKAGISFYAKSSANPGVTELKDICGKTVGVEKGTVEQEESEAQSKKCGKEGKKSVTVLSFSGQNAVNLAIASGRAEVGLADSPVVDYQIKKSGGQFKLVGKTYAFAPYGLAIPKTSGMTKPILAALKELIANGKYKAILEKWGIQSGAITEPTINGAIS
ncbi:MAG: polar amino acid transport system substrate-binding protein [Solirubrobacteraceae bacterium]|jgi:polar amino acid transport system substrate-binding protein|nr:polar amino acid transport system substrate-binding protein [Solirubrobacteraceae bacterium]